jgi:diguanylate cyclase (GGDEF)-like protein/PAS domain S-box-containing protein
MAPAAARGGIGMFDGISLVKKPVVLIADDDLVALTVFCDTLSEAGFEVITAGDGVTALEAFHRVKPDLVLLDLVMPGKDGIEVCQEIRSLSGAANIPVVMVTSTDEVEIIHRAFDAGASDFLSKPIKPELLVYRLRCLLRTSVTMKRLVRSEERNSMLKEAIDSLPIGITFSDPQGTIMYLNPAEARMHGYQVEELIGRDAGILSNQQRSSGIRRQSQGGQIWRQDGISIRKDGSQFPVQLASISVLNSASWEIGTVTTREDLSDKKEAEEKIRLLSCFDSLTGLPNRGMFLDRLHKALDQARRDGDRVGLLFLDLENFSNVNKARGHAFGDQLLCEVSARLAGCMSDSDYLARLGGDEFVAVLSSVEDQRRAVSLAERIRSTLASPFEIDGSQVYTSASIGIAFYPDDSHDASTLFRCADTAMYHARSEGRSQYRFFASEMNQRLLRRVAMENSLRQGLERKEFFLHYQPQLDLHSRTVVGVEVLLRWQSPEFGLVSPAEFVPLCEDSGLILKLGEWVLRTACEQSRSWAEAGHSSLRTAVNVSGKQLKEPDFIEMLMRVVNETGVDPGNIELELTESVIMENADRTAETLRAVKRMGIQLSLDDFGTGYSSLNYLKHFPFDRIKIDRSFVSGVSSDSDDATIIEAIVSMAQSLELKVVAEGVESAEQLQQLTELGCDEAQGFYLAKPASAPFVGQLLGGVLGKKAEPGRRTLAFPEHGNRRASN